MYFGCRIKLPALCRRSLLELALGLCDPSILSEDLLIDAVPLCDPVELILIGSEQAILIFLFNILFDLEVFELEPIVGLFILACVGDVESPGALV